ncbi:protein of unknown function [Afipia sp. GAS231]|nr:protein of unknown function [Afipia sp. GAS231]
MVESKTTFDKILERHRPPVEHVLKCWPEFFRAIRTGKKKHDLRRATDRSFQEGDTLLLREFDPKTNKYTGDVQRVLVTYITSSDLPCALSKDALHDDFCILSIELQ